jgi:hypothetical protein
LRSTRSIRSSRPAGSRSSTTTAPPRCDARPLTTTEPVTGCPSRSSRSTGRASTGAVLRNHHREGRRRRRSSRARTCPCMPARTPAEAAESSPNENKSLRPFAGLIVGVVCRSRSGRTWSNRTPEVAWGRDARPSSGSSFLGFCHASRRRRAHGSAVPSRC